MTVRRRYKETKSFYKIKRLVSCENTYWIGKYTANFFFFSKKLGINWCMLLNYANVLEHTDNKQSVGLDIKEQIVDNVLVEYLHWQPISFVLIFFHTVVLRIIWSREAISDLVSRNFDAWNAVWKLFCPLPAVALQLLAKLCYYIEYENSSLRFLSQKGNVCDKGFNHTRSLDLRTTKWHW